MRGIKECLNYMLNNPMKEISHSANPSSFRRRYNDYYGYFEYFNNKRLRWEILTSLYAHTDYSDFDYGIEWFEYDPNPAVDFHVAYMDCLENNSIYKNTEGDKIEKHNNRVIIGLHEPKLICGVILNSCKWKKVL